MICESCLRKDEIISELRAENEKLRKRIEQLEEQVKEIKSWIWKPKKQTNNPNKLGPPRNHKPNNRPMPDKIHKKIRLPLHKCPDCGHKLSRLVRVRKRYVGDIRPPEPINTEYHIPYYWCKHCRKQVSPKPADVIPNCRFGIKLMLLITFFRYGISLPLNKIATLLGTCYSISISEGCLVDSITRFAEHVGPEFERIKQDIRKAASTHIDTTSWRINGQNKVLWDFISEKHMLLLVRDTKAQGIVYQTLGTDYKGISITDCASEYQYLGWEQQKCWVHLLRYTRKLESRAGKKLHNRLKALLELARSGKAGKRALLSRLDRITRTNTKDEKCINIIKRVVKYRDCWFTFVGNEHVSYNNNAAESGLRPSVVMRKITGGNRSDKGARNHEVIMSVMGTWDKQGNDFLDYGMEYITNRLQ